MESPKQAKYYKDMGSEGNKEDVADIFIQSLFALLQLVSVKCM